MMYITIQQNVYTILCIQQNDVYNEFFFVNKSNNEIKFFCMLLLQYSNK